MLLSVPDILDARDSRGIFWEAPGIGEHREHPLRWGIDVNRLANGCHTDLLAMVLWSRHISFVRGVLASSTECGREEVRQSHVTTLSSGSLLKLGCENMRRSPYFLVSLQGSEEVVFHGEEGRCGPRGDGNLVVDVLGMLVDGLLGDDEELGDLLLSMPAGE
jgi:hypothetical protein